MSSIYPFLGLFLTLVGSWFMKMHECVRRKVYLTYSSVKSWKSLNLCIRFIENVDLAAFSKDFLLLKNRKQTMRRKRVCPELSDLEIWYEVSPYRSKSTDQVSLETYLPDIKVKWIQNIQSWPWRERTFSLMFVAYVHLFKY